MLYIKQKDVNKLIEHAKRESPNEACGILAGKRGRVVKIYEMANTDKSPQTFFMDPRAQLRVMKEIRQRGEEMVGIYHSHVASEARPSSRDVELAFYPEVSYVIVSIKDKDNPRIRSFKIVEGKINEEEVRLG